MTEGTTTRVRGFESGAVIAVAMAVMNVSTYAFQIVAARGLGPQSYGAFAALMNLLLVVSVMSLALQATAARRISAHPEHVAQIEREVLRFTYRTAIAFGLVLLALAPVINLVLVLDDLAAAALVGVIAVPLTVMGGQAGILQGERRWRPLAVLYASAGLPRLVIGTGLLLWSPSELTAAVSVAIGAVAPVVVGTVALRHRRSKGATSVDHDTRSIIREVGRSSQALLAIFALSNVDVIVARNVLDGNEAGLYAAGLIMTKAVLFLPQFVVVVFFPAMSTVRERQQALVRGLLLMTGIGVVAVVGAHVLSPIAILFVGGDAYLEIEGRLWLFALLGTVLAMLQLLVYSVLARQGRRSVYAPWAALVVLVAVGLTCETPGELLTVVVIVDATLLAALLVASVWLTSHDRSSAR